MSQDNVIEDVMAEVSRAFAQVINASTALAVAMIELRIQRLREASRQDGQQMRAARDQMRAHHKADAAVWRAAMRPQWWRDAGAEDIGRVWRAASMWQHVDPRAAEARQVVVDRLAERGVHVDPTPPSPPGPDNLAWLSDALDRAAAEQAAREEAAAAERKAGAGRGRNAEPGDSKVYEGQVMGEEDAGTSRRKAWQDREERAAEHVRAVWSPERAERVINCEAWDVLVGQLHHWEEQGHDAQGLLRGVPNFVDRAHTPAAFAYRSIADRLDGLVDLGTQSSGAPAATRSEERREEPADAQTPAAQEPASAPAADGEAAAAAAQAYPVPTSDAVAAAAAKVSAQAAGAPISAGARAVPGPVPALDGAESAGR